MADLTSDQAIEKLRALPEDKQRAVLTALSPEERSGIIGKLKAPSAKIPATPAAAKQSFLSKVATQPSEFKPGNPLRYADLLGKGMASGAEAILHPIDTAKQIGAGLRRGTIFDPQAEEHAKEDRAEDEKPFKEQASDVADTLAEGYGQAVTGTVAGKVLDEGLGAVGKLRKATAAGIQPLARKVTGVETAVKEQVGKAAEKQGEALEKHAETSDNVAQREQLAKTVDTKSHALGQHLEKVEASVGREAGKKFDAVRAKLGISEGNAGPEVKPDQLVDTVRNIEENVLQGIPENIKEFRSIVGHGEEAPEGLRESFKKATGAEPLGGKPFTWDKLQSLKSRIDARLRNSRGMNGDLKRGLLQARDAVVNTMGEIAEPHGAGPEWADAKTFYRQYKEDFHEPTGPSGSGSPVAQALDAVDPKNIRQPFLRTQSTIGNRGTQILRKYPQHGGTEAADLADEVVGHHQSLQDLPNKPKGFSPDKPPASPAVDTNKVSREKIAQVAKNWGSFNARDVGILGSSFAGEVVGSIFGHGFAGAVIGPIGYESAKFGMSRVLNKPAVIEWLARTPPEEISVLNKIPGADKVKLVNGITETAIQNKATNLSPAMKSLLGPANVARIMAVTGATQAQNPADAKQRMRQFAPTP